MDKKDCKNLFDLFECPKHGYVALSNLLLEHPQTKKLKTTDICVLINLLYSAKGTLGWFVCPRKDHVIKIHPKTFKNSITKLALLGYIDVHKRYRRKTNFKFKVVWKR